MSAPCPREKVCWACGLRWHPSNSDDQAMAEFQENFAADPAALANVEKEGPAVICDACYEEFMDAYRRGELEGA